MKILKISKDKLIYLIGDTHGKWNKLNSFINEINQKNPKCNIGF